MGKVKFKALVYHPNYDELGEIVLFKNMLLVNVGTPGVYRALTSAWQQIGFL